MSGRLSQEILQKIKNVEIHTRRLLRSGLPGDGRSYQKGFGLDFDQIRDYQVGDDVRFIDWTASARMNTLLVKQYIESRSREIIIAVDVSGSTAFSSSSLRKADSIAQVASALALIAEHGNDRVGLILFSDKIEAYIPPRKGLAHVRAIMARIFSHQAAGLPADSQDSRSSSGRHAVQAELEGAQKKNKETDFGALFKKLAALKRKDAIVCMVSDFIGAIPQEYSGAMARLYTLVAIRCLDRNEYTLPAIGFIPVRDIESGVTVLLDTRAKRNNQLAGLLDMRIKEQDGWFKRQGIARLDVHTHKNFIDDMVGFFKRRV
jgi:uncharacterized protein (DUF58 family)